MTQSDDSLRIGIIGAGQNTIKQHIPRLQAIDGVTIHSVCNRSVESGQAVADQFSIPHVRDSWGQVIDDDEVDAVLIGTWPNMHSTLSIEALQVAKHVLCEARMAMDSREAHTMWDYARGNPETIAMVVPSPFTLHVDDRIRELLAGGAIGDLINLDISAVSGEFCDPETEITWRQQRKYSGNNTLTLGIWYEAVSRWVGHAKSVQALASTQVRLRPDGQKGKAVADVPDHLDVLAELYCGASARFRCSTVLGIPPGMRNAAVLYGTEGTLMYSADTNRLYLGKPGQDEIVPMDTPGTAEDAWCVEEEWISAIAGIEPVRHTTFEEGVRYMEFTDAVMKSSRNGNRIQLPLEL